MLLLEEQDRAFDVRDLASEVRFTKRGVAEALEGLTIAGMIHATTVGNSRRYSLNRRSELENLFGPLPRIRTSQRALCRILLATIDLTEEIADATERVRRVEVARILRELGPELRRVDPHVGFPNEGDSAFDFLQGFCAVQCSAARGEGSN